MKFKDLRSFHCCTRIKECNRLHKAKYFLFNSFLFARICLNYVRRLKHNKTMSSGFGFLPMSAVFLTRSPSNSRRWENTSLAGSFLIRSANPRTMGQIQTGWWDKYKRNNGTNTKGQTGHCLCIALFSHVAPISRDVIGRIPNHQLNCDWSKPDWRRCARSALVACTTWAANWSP